MPGVPGAGGPIPKRSDQRRRRNAGPKVDKVSATAAVNVPEPDENWPDVVQNLFRSLGRSGQAEFYQESDWAFARLTCELLARGLSAEKMPAMLITAVMADLARLGVTEGDRRRMRIEVERSEPEMPASVAIMDKYRRAAGGK